MALEVFEHGTDKVAKLRCERLARRGSESSVQPLRQLLAARFDQAVEQRLAVREMIVERAYCHSGLAGDLLHPRAVDAPAGEDLLGGFGDGADGLLAEAIPQTNGPFSW